MTDALSQLSFGSLIKQAATTRRHAIDRFMHANRNMYLTFAREITPDLRVWTHVWDRAAFAILTANAVVEDAVRAFHLARSNDRIAPRFWGVTGMTPQKADYVNALPRGDEVFALRKRRSESWDVYRLRLVVDVEGLALTKASYLACLLYPMRAQVACLDTWMQRLLLGTTHFVSLKHLNVYRLPRLS